MRHRKRTNTLNRNSSHRKALTANMLKSLIVHGRIETTPAKAKVIRPYAERLVTLAKKGTLADRRNAIAKLQLRYNSLTPKEARNAKNGDTSAYNDDRKVINILFDELASRFTARTGG